MRRRDDAPTTFAALGIERRPAPTPTAKVAKPAPLEPTMIGDLYEHVIGLIRSMGRAMERTPDIYGRHKEEQLRDQLLAMLNSHYEGQATGETFNAAGKTDILVRVEDRNVFIGECKWWSGGPFDFFKALEQLFSYSTWRDTKLALVIFVRAKGPHGSGLQGSRRAGSSIRGSSSGRTAPKRPSFAAGRVGPVTRSATPNWPCRSSFTWPHRGAVKERGTNRHVGRGSWSGV